MDSAILDELKRHTELLERLVQAQESFFAVLMADEDEQPALDLDGNVLPPDRNEFEEL